MEGHWKFLAGDRVLKTKILEARYEAKLDLLGGRGYKTKNFCVGGVKIFSGTVQYIIC